MNSSKTTTLPSRKTAPDVVTYDAFPSRHVRPRRVDVWLPPGYDPKAALRYPVLYMHDGQNIISARTAFGGVEWGIDETLRRLKAEGLPMPILVLVWNTSLRFAEYQPQAPFERLPEVDRQALLREFQAKQVLSDAYLRFLTEELKPYVDAHFHTQPDPAHTAIMGSSMGGLISMYAWTQYPDVFGKAACLSTHWPGSLTQPFVPLFANTLSYLDEKVGAPNPKRRIYFDHGTAGLDSLYGYFQKRVDSLFAAKGYADGPLFHSQVFAGANHTERDWARRAEVPLRFLLKP